MPINGQAEVTVIKLYYKNYYSKRVILEVEQNDFPCAESPGNDSENATGNLRALLLGTRTIVCQGTQPGGNMKWCALPQTDEDHDIIVQHEFQNYVLAILSKEQNLSGDEETDNENEEEIEEKSEKEKHSKTPEGEKSGNSTVETVETEETTQKETIIQQEKESTDNHTVNNSSENTDDQVTGEIVGRKKFSLFKRKPLTGQKNVCSRKEDRSGKPLQSGQEKEKEDLSGEDSKDENQNHTLENSRETVTNQDRRMKSSTCILL
nr:PREDICTED: uncharacterized protein LOC104321212 [Haliaeetus albicilla]